MGTAGQSSTVLIALGGAVFFAHPAAAVDPLNPYAPCSVFHQAPCNPSFCSVFGHWPCVPVLPPVGQGLRVTIASGAENGHAPDGSINSIRDLYAALRTCWEPPPLNEAFSGMQMSVRFSFKRTGELVGPPRVTYTNSAAGPDAKRSYGRAIDAAIERCTPMPFTKEMGGAIAGQPISIRFVDNRK